MKVTGVSVHGVQAGEEVRLLHLEQTDWWVLSVGGIDFYADELDVLAAVVDHAGKLIEGARR